MVNGTLKKYIEQNIFPEYEKNEKAHGIEHIQNVINRSLELSQNYNVDLDIVYTIAAFHDIGHSVDAKKHEIISAEIFEKDETMKQFFTSPNRKIIKEAIEDHRASAKTKPRSIYGKIISSADRGIPNIEERIVRTYYYGKKHYPELNEKEQKKRIEKHLKNKFGTNGYAKIYIKNEKYEKASKQFQEILEDENLLRQKIDEVIQKENGNN